MAPTFRPALLLACLAITALLATSCGEDTDEYGTDATVVAIDAATGEELWRTHTDGWTIDPPTLADGLLYVQGHDAFYALDPATGEEVWRYDEQAFSTTRSAPPVIDGVALIAGHHDSPEAFTHPLVAIDADTGDVLWREGCIPGGYYGVTAGPDAVYLQSICEIAGQTPEVQITAYELQSGTTRWATENLQVGNVVGVGWGPVYADGHVIYSSHDGSLHALDAATGDEVWQVADAAGTLVSAGGGLAFVWDSPGEDISVHDLTTGDLLWRLDTAQGDYGVLNVIIEGYPAASSGQVFAFSDTGTLVALDALSGDEMWSAATTAGVLATDDDTVYVGSRGIITALDRRTGKERWKQTVDDGERTVLPMVSDGVIYAAIHGDPPPYED